MLGRRNKPPTPYEFRRKSPLLDSCRNTRNPQCHHHISEWLSLPWFKLTNEESAFIVLLVFGAIYWSTPKIENSDYTRHGLYWNQFIKLGLRAGKRAFKQFAKKFPSLDFLVKLLEEDKTRKQSRQVVEDFVTIAFEDLGMPSSFRPTGDKLDYLVESV